MEDAYNLFLSKSIFKDFYLCFCGKSDCEPGHPFGPHVRPTYIIHYILKGKGIYRIGKREYKLEAGQGFLIEPNVLTYYEADSEDPWSYIWVSFSGEKSKDYLKEVGLGDGKVIFSTSHGDELEKIVDEIFVNNEKEALRDFLAQAYLCAFFNVLSLEKTISTTQKSDYENSYVQSAVDFIKQNYNNEITVQDVANWVNIDRSYLFNLFKKERNCSPLEYLTNYRIAKAKELLAQTDYTVETICYSCGYVNIVTFSKAFKRVTGKSPTQYRQFERDFHKQQYAKVRKK